MKQISVLDRELNSTSIDSLFMVPESYLKTSRMEEIFAKIIHSEARYSYNCEKNP